MSNRVVERRSRPHRTLRAHSGSLGAAVLIAALLAPAASAVEPMIEGGDETAFVPSAGVGPQSDPPLTLAASTSGSDWSAALLVLLIGLAVFAIVIAVHQATTRRRHQLAAGAPFAP